MKYRNVAIFASAVILGGLGLKWRVSVQPSQPVDSSGQSGAGEGLAKGNASPLAHNNEATRKRARAQLATLLPRVPRPKAEEAVAAAQAKSSLEELAPRDQALVRSALALVELQNNVLGGEATEEIWEHLAADEAQVAAVAEMLTAPASARERYGESQGLARVVGIELLTRVAREGDARPLASALSGLTAHIGSLEEMGQPLEKGALLDFDDLLYTYVSLHKQSLQADVGAFFDTLPKLASLDYHYRRTLGMVARDFSHSERESVFSAYDAWIAE